MIDLHYFPTPNGWKVSIALEELGLPYRLVSCNIARGEQFEPGFLAISPNGRIPAIVDPDGPAGTPLLLFESGAILLYLADKTGLFLPADEDGRWAAVEWLMWQMGGVGPSFGQAFHFLHQHPEDVPDADIVYGRDRYGGEVRRLCAVMDGRLSENAYLAGADYSVADIATFPWIALHKWFGQDLAETPHLQRWYDVISERPAVRRGMDVPTREALGL